MRWQVWCVEHCRLFTEDSSGSLMKPLDKYADHCGRQSHTIHKTRAKLRARVCGVLRFTSSTLRAPQRQPSGNKAQTAIRVHSSNRSYHVSVAAVVSPFKRRGRRVEASFVPSTASGKHITTISWCALLFDQGSRAWTTASCGGVRCISRERPRQPLFSQGTGCCRNAMENVPPHTRTIE